MTITCNKKSYYWDLFVNPNEAAKIKKARYNVNALGRALDFPRVCMDGKRYSAEELIAAIECRSERLVMYLKKL